MPRERERGGDAVRTPRRTTLVSIAAAVALVTLKLGAGLVSGSLGLISTGIESSGDVVASVLTFFAVRLGGRPADREHPYGHRRAENLGALGEAAILLAGAVFIPVEALGHLVRDAAAPAIHAYQFAVIALALALDESPVAPIGGDVELGGLRLRKSAGRYFADVVVTVPPGQAVVEGQGAASRVEDARNGALPGSDVVVHVEPRRRGVELRQRILA